MGKDCSFRDATVRARRSGDAVMGEKCCVGENKIIHPMKESSLKLRMPVFIRYSDYNPGKATWKFDIATVSGSAPPLPSVSKLTLGSGGNIYIQWVLHSSPFLQITSRWVSLGTTYRTRHWEEQLPSRLWLSCLTEGRQWWSYLMSWHLQVICQKMNQQTEQKVDSTAVSSTNTNGAGESMVY